MRAGDWVITSGQLPLKDGEIVSGGIEAETKQVVANRLIAGPKELSNPPAMCIGSDEAGEPYMGDSFGQLWMFQPSAK